MRKLCTILAALALVILCIAFLPTEAEAATYGNLTYTISNGEVTITDCDTLVTGTVEIPSVIDGYPVTAIGNMAFQDCRNPIKVIIPNSVTTLGIQAFCSCEVTEVTIPNSVVSIGQDAFDSCEYLTSVTIPASVTTIGEGAFANCDSLTGITVASGNPNYSSDEQGVLYNKDKTTLIQAPGAATSCVIPNGVTTIGESAFAYAQNLSSVVIPNSVAAISKYAFRACYGLESVTYCGTEAQWSAISIGMVNTSLTNATRDYHAWSEVDCKTVATCTFCGASGEYGDHSVEDGICTICQRYGICGDDLIWTLDGRGYMQISGTGEMYSYNYSEIPWYTLINSIYDVTINDGVTSIGNNAFAECTYLLSVTISDSVTTIGDYAFQSSGLTALEIPGSVTTIGEAAFAYCDNLIDHVYIGYGVITIGEGAFVDCNHLMRINIPDSVTTIGQGAFFSCDSLTGITVTANNPNYSSDEQGILYNKDKTTLIQAPGAIETCVIPNGVTAIGSSAFSGCESLNDVTYCGTEEQWNAISIGNYNTILTNATRKYHNYVDGTCSACGAINDRCSHNVVDGICTVCGKYGTCGDNLTWELDDEGTLTISGTGEMYDYKDFGAPWYAHKDTIYSVTVDDGVTRIGEHAFSRCPSMTSVTIPDSVNSIGFSAFYYCDGLNSVIIPDSVTVIGHYAFFGCANLNSVSIGNSVTIGNGVTTIGEFAFSNCPGLTNVTIGDNVTTIGYRAFSYCTSLTGVTIGNSVTSIGHSAFYSCDSLTSVSIGSSVTSIGNEAFYECTSLTSITIPDSVTTIGSRAFYDCTSLTNVTIPDSVTTIGSRAFSYCTSLTSVIIPGSVTSIGSCAFGSCSNLTGIWVNTENTAYSSDASGVLFNKDMTKLIAMPGGFTGAYTIPDGVTSIGDWAFGFCGNVTSVIIPNSVTSIGEDAFYYCKSLTSVTIPDSVTSIGDRAFAACDKLSSVTIPDSVASIGNSAFSGCTSLSSMIIPDSITSIGNYTFSGCTSLTEVTIPGSVNTIGYSAFNGCTNLTSVTIPNSVTTIDDRAFSNCTNLTDVTYCGTEEQWNTISIGLSNGKLNNATRKYHDFNEGVVTKEPTIIETGIKTYTCSNCGDCYTEEIPVAVPTDDATLVMRNDGALNLAAFIGAQFSVTKEIAEKYDTVYVEITHNGETKTLELKASDDGSVYFAEYGIAAKQMADPIDIKLFAKKGDTTYAGQVVEGWTVKAKLVKMLDDYYPWMSYGGAYETTPKLAAAMLAYGAAAQNQFSYNLDNLATDGVNADYLALVPTEAPAMEAMPTFDNTSYQASLYNPAFMLDDVIKASLTFAIGDSKIENYKARVTINGVTKDYELIQYVSGGNTYPGYAYIIIDSIVAADLRQDFSVTIMKGETATSTTYTFSMENLAAKLYASRTEIITAIMNYSDAAYAKFRG